MIYHIGVVSLGCAKNLVDTETMLGLLHREGFKITNKEEQADILIVNTCGFIESAKQESIENILELAEYKEKGKCKLLIVTGCLVERYKEEIINEMPEVDAIVGTGNYHEIAEVINQAFEGQKIQKVGNQDFSPEEGLPRIQSTPKYTAYLKIADGCDNHCTYCIIPKLRGRYRSRKMEAIIQEANQLAQNGVKELLIIAQDTSRYGIDLYDAYKLDELLNELCNIKGIEWIRLHYCYPENITEKLIDTIASQPKICNYIDIPIQHCSDEVLKKMGRKSTKENLNSLIFELREKIPTITIRTSLIVGFPGETEKQFEELVDFVEEIHFDRMGVFKYSQEEDTPAAKLDNQIDEETKQIRYEKLMTIQSEISVQVNAKKVGKCLDVLIEGFDADSGFYYGRTYADSIDIDGMVLFKSKHKLKTGTFVKVNISEAEKYDLIGVVSNEFSE